MVGGRLGYRSSGVYTAIMWTVTVMLDLKFARLVPTLGCYRTFLAGYYTATSRKSTATDSTSTVLNGDRIRVIIVAVSDTRRKKFRLRFPSSSLQSYLH